MIDLQREEAVSLSQAAAILPRVNGRRIHTSTLWRWARRGLRGVKLGYVRVGDRIFTSREALTRFANALAEQDERATRPTERREPRSRSHAQRRRDVAQVNSTLRAAGVVDSSEAAGE